MRLYERSVVAAVAACFFLTVGEVGTSVSAGADSSGRTIGRADAFVDAIGLDTHFNYNNTPYVLAWPALSEALIASGIRHIRDGGKPDPLYVARLKTLGEHGIGHAAGFSIKATAAEIDAHLTAYAPYVEYVEGPNEYDFARKTEPDWAANLAAFQKMLYDTVRANPAYAGIKVLGPPLAHQDLYAEVGDLDRFEDAGNLHIGTCDQNPGTADAHEGNIAYTHQLLRTSTPTKPIWTTETGYGDDMSRHCAVGDETIAKYIPRTLAEKWNAGEDRVYFYQYADMPTDKIFGSLGLMHADGSPKPQFTALTSLIRVLADPGAPFVPHSLAYSLGGDTRDVHTTLLQKRDGRYELLLWLEVPSWDRASQAARPVRSQAVTLSLPAKITTAKMYTYAPNWSLGAKPLTIRAGSARLEVGDSISIVELTP